MNSLALSIWQVEWKSRWRPSSNNPRTFNISQGEMDTKAIYSSNNHKRKKTRIECQKVKRIIFIFYFFKFFFFYSPLIITSDESAAVRVGVVTRVLASLFSSSIFSNVLTVMDFIVRCCCWPFLFLEFHFVSMSQLQRSKENHILFVKDVHPKR